MCINNKKNRDNIYNTPLINNSCLNIVSNTKINYTSKNYLKIKE